MAERLGDEQLMKQLAEGDKKAADELYDRYYKNVYGYFVSQTHDADASRDLTQNVFLKIIRYSESWNEEGANGFCTIRLCGKTHQGNLTAGQSEKKNSACPSAGGPFKITKIC